MKIRYAVEDVYGKNGLPNKTEIGFSTVFNIKHRIYKLTEKKLRLLDNEDETGYEMCCHTIRILTELIYGNKIVRKKLDKEIRMELKK